MRTPRLPLAAGDNGSLTSVPVRDTKLGKADFVWRLAKVAHLPRLWGKYKDWVGEGKEEGRKEERQREREGGRAPNLLQGGCDRNVVSNHNVWRKMVGGKKWHWIWSLGRSRIQRHNRHLAVHSGEMNIPVTRIGKKVVPSRRQGLEEPTLLQLFYRKGQNMVPEPDHPQWPPPPKVNLFLGKNFKKHRERDSSQKEWCTFELEILVAFHVPRE